LWKVLIDNQRILLDYVSDPDSLPVIFTKYPLHFILQQLGEIFSDESMERAGLLVVDFFFTTCTDILAQMSDKMNLVPRGFLKRSK